MTGYLNSGRDKIKIAADNPFHPGSEAAIQLSFLEREGEKLNKNCPSRGYLGMVFKEGNVLAPP